MAQRGVYFFMEDGEVRSDGGTGPASCASGHMPEGQVRGQNSEPAEATSRSAAGGTKRLLFLASIVSILRAAALHSCAHRPSLVHVLALRFILCFPIVLSSQPTSLARVRPRPRWRHTGATGAALQLRARIQCCSPNAVWRLFDAADQEVVPLVRDFKHAGNRTDTRSSCRLFKIELWI
jgi:hypothetical protein